MCMCHTCVISLYPYIYESWIEADLCFVLDRDRLTFRFCRPYSQGPRLWFQGQSPGRPYSQWWSTNKKYSHNQLTGRKTLIYNYAVQTHKKTDIHHNNKLTGIKLCLNSYQTEYQYSQALLSKTTWDWGTFSHIQEFEILMVKYKEKKEKTYWNNRDIRMAIILYMIFKILVF